jgi:hypothetical protein
MKRSVSMFLAVLVVASLAACNRGERTSVTGSYGQGVVTGQVTMAAGLGSPDGVDVSVRGTGMSTLLGADGQFTFSGVPDGAALDFRRSSDGVSASLPVPAGQGFVNVSLSKHGATSFKRRGGNESELEGIVSSITTTALVMVDRRLGEQTVQLTANTLIRKGSATVAPADIQPGWRVHVKATKAADVYTAVQVIVQNTRDDNGGDDDRGEDDGPGIREFEGSIRSATATSLVVFTSHREEVTFVITAETEIRRGNDRLTAADLKADMRVHVKAKVAGTTNSAVRITVQNK